jgi:hypothetical protein
VATTDEIAILRIELQGIEPLTWRRVGVSTTMSLMDLHRVIQELMGWLDSHLWDFEAAGRRYAMRLPSEPDWNERYEDAEAATLRALADTGVRRMNYVYDMGDYWEHAVIIERVTAPLPNVTYPQFLGGERRCPPEDCGGVPGYYEFLENIGSEDRAERKSALDWYGGPYDPNDIGEQKVISALRRIASARIGR